MGVWWWRWGAAGGLVRHPAGAPPAKKRPGEKRGGVQHSATQCTPERLQLLQHYMYQLAQCLAQCLLQPDVDSTAASAASALASVRHCARMRALVTREAVHERRQHFHSAASHAVCHDRWPACRAPLPRLALLLAWAGEAHHSHACLQQRAMHGWDGWSSTVAPSSKLQRSVSWAGAVPSTHVAVDGLPLIHPSTGLHMPASHTTWQGVQARM